MVAGRLTVGIDARAASHPQPGGFKSYVKNLVLGLAAIDGRNSYQLYVDRPVLGEMSTLGQSFRMEVVAGRVPTFGPVWREQVLLPAKVASDELDVIHFPSGTAPVRFSGPGVVTIHDAIEHMPREVTGAAWAPSDLKRQLMLLYSRYSQRMAVRQATLVLTDSECSRRDIIKYLRVTESKIRVIPEAPAPEFRPISRAMMDGMLVGLEPFVLAIGSADPRKNLAMLIRAYAALPADLIARYRLVLVWSHGLLKNQLLQLARDLGVLERVVSQSALTDEDLCRLYNAATVFVFPSLYEGFGLPPLEAMACGAPVIASNRSCLPEVLGEAALPVNPGSVTQLTQAMSTVLSDGNLRQRLSSHGLDRVRRFSWERTARLTLAAYEEAVREF